MENMVNNADLSTYKGKKVFVTGHTGFKGSWLVNLLHQLGAEIGGYALSPNTSPNHFDLQKLPVVSNIGDIADAEFLQRSIHQFEPEIVFHLAAQPLVRESYVNPINTYQTNVMGTLNLLEAIRKCPSVKAVVLITTDKVYENKEWVFPYRETDELGGYDMYSSSKACSEILIKSFRNSFLNIEDFGTKHNILLASARAGNVIGGGDWSNDRLIPDIVKATALGNTVSIRNPLAVRPWQHVLDCLHGYLLLGSKLLAGKKEFTDAWNFAPYSFESKTVEEIATISKFHWPEIDISFGIPPENYHEAGLLKLDNTKSFNKLGWKPIWNTTEAVEKTINWYKAFYQKNTSQTQDNIKEYLQSL
jgi:CDP-glucose 4,6-dehydratase